MVPIDATLLFCTRQRVARCDFPTQPNGHYPMLGLATSLTVCAPTLPRPCQAIPFPLTRAFYRAQQQLHQAHCHQRSSYRQTQLPPPQVQTDLFAERLLGISQSPELRFWLLRLPWCTFQLQIRCR